MKLLMPALQMRYTANSELTRIGKALVRPVEDVAPNYPASYTVVDGELIETQDDFAADTELWEIRFGLVGKSVRPNDADTWQREMFRSFEDANLISPSAAFDCNGTKALDQVAPSIAGHMFVASCRIEVYVTLSVKNPPVRGV